MQIMHQGCINLDIYMKISTMMAQLFHMPPCLLIPCSESFGRRIQESICKEEEDMRDYLTIGSAPCDEDCAQVGQPNSLNLSLFVEG
jgi:hypothetical protein